MVDATKVLYKNFVLSNDMAWFYYELEKLMKSCSNIRFSGSKEKKSLKESFHNKEILKMLNKHLTGLAAPDINIPAKEALSKAGLRIPTGLDHPYIFLQTVCGRLLSTSTNTGITVDSFRLPF